MRKTSLKIPKWVLFMSLCIVVVIAVFSLILHQRNLSSQSNEFQGQIHPTAIPKKQTNSPPGVITNKTLKYLPIAVGKGVGTDWFSSWAREDDMLVYFQSDLNTITVPSKGKVGWNNPSFANVIETESQWKGKVDVILYDYELWEKTPEDEKADPGSASKKAQQYADQNNIMLLMGSSWKMVTSRDPSIVYGRINKEKIQTIARNVKNYGFNASGLRRTDDESYLTWFKTCASYAREANPSIKIWFMVNSQDQTASEMLSMTNKLVGAIDGISIMGNNRKSITTFVSQIRQ